ncbi:MAG: efflux RND transporter periplasmic adaptor subunit [Caulobacterales bacterium]
MKFKSSYLVVAVIVGLVAVWLVLRPLMGHPQKGADSPGAGAAQAAAPTAPPLVQISLVPEVQRPYTLTIRGRTQAARTVVLRSETAGTVDVAPVLQGSYVSAGTVLCRLSVDARQAALAEAKANLQSKELQIEASRNLAARGFRSQTQVLSDQASVDDASASVRQAEVALAQVNIRAPFAGVFDHRDAEIGAYLAPGQSCGTMVELDPLLIVGDIPETETSKVRVGQPVAAKLVSGETIQGRVRYVAHDADPATRTYRVEVTARNPGGVVRSGLSADIEVDAGQAAAHLVPVAALVLDAGGRQGVRWVGADGRVSFTVVNLLEETPAGLWVSGLHGPTRVITVGQSYVSEGQVVRVAER